MTVSSPYAGPRAPTTSASGRRQRNRWFLFSLPYLLFLIIPLIALLLRASPAAIAENLRNPLVQSAIVISLRTTLLAAFVTLLVGTPVAYLLARRLVPAWRVIDTLVDLPTVLPPSVAGVALLMAFGRRGLLGSSLAVAGIEIGFTELAVVMAQIFVAAPLYIKTAAVGFAGTALELEQAAALDGAGASQVFRHVTLPLARVALVSGGVMMWARALGEFGATIIFAGNFPGRTQTMPLAIYTGFELDLNLALTLSVILMGISFLVLAIVKGVLHYQADD